MSKADSTKEKFTLNVESVKKIIDGVDKTPSVPKYDISRNVGDNAVGGGAVAIGTKFVIVENFDSVIDNDTTRESVIVPMLRIVDTEGNYNTLSAGALSGSATLSDGSRVTPDTLNVSKRKLAYKAIVGTKLSNVANKLHEIYGELALYEIVGFKRLEKGDTKNNFAKNVYSIAVVE